MKRLMHVASRFINTPLMLHPPKLEVIIKALGPRLGIDAQLVPRSEAPDVLAAQYNSAGGDEPDYQVVDGIAVVSVQGTLLKKETWMSAWSGCTAYESLHRQIAQAVDDGTVRAILLDIDSPGGETNGCFELSDFIFSVRGLKPIYAAANDMALSAAYAIASAADKIYVTRTGTVGSVGVYALHASQAKFDKDVGVEYKYIHHGAKKVDGNPHANLSDSAEADIQAEVDREGVIFESTVARNRKVDAKDIVALEAGLLWADAAIPLLADEVGTADDAMNALRVLTGVPGFNVATATTQTRSLKMADVNVAPVAGQEASATPVEIGAKKADTETDMKKCAKCGAKSAKADSNYCAKCGAKFPGDNPDTDNDEDDDKEESKKAAASALVGLAGAAPLKASRTNEDIQAIGALCNMAGFPDKATEFLASNQSVADVSEALTQARVAESEKHPIVSTVNPNKGAARIQDMEAEAVSYVRQNAGKVVPALYVEGASRKVTKEMAMAQALEANPEVYAAFRARHNAGDLVRRLSEAGYQLSERA